jgi:hypothetical protein
VPWLLSTVVVLSISLNLPFCDSGEPRVPVETDTMLEVVLDQSGAVFARDFELRKPRHVRLRSYFPAAELGSVSQKLLDENVEEVVLRGSPLLSAGWYRLELRAQGHSAEPFHFKVITAPPREVQRPSEEEIANTNVDAESAERLSLPDRRILRVDQVRPQHWYRFEVDEQGFLLFRLEGRNGAPQAQLLVQDAEGGALPYQSVNSDRGNALYARVESGSYHLKIWEEPARGVGEAGTEVLLTTRFRSSDYEAVGGVGVLTIGLDESSGDMQGLSFMADATGLPLIQTFSADDIEWVLAKAIGDELGPRPVWASLAIAVLILGLWIYLRLIRRASDRIFRQLKPAATEGEGVSS